MTSGTIADGPIDPIKGSRWTRDDRTWATWTRLDSTTGTYIPIIEVQFGKEPAKLMEVSTRAPSEREALAEVKRLLQSHFGLHRCD